MKSTACIEAMMHRWPAFIGDYVKGKEATKSELAQKIACVSSAGVRPLCWKQLDEAADDGSNIAGQNAPLFLLQELTSGIHRVLQDRSMKNSVTPHAADAFNPLTRQQSIAVNERLI